jgi:hypothetical protein
MRQGSGRGVTVSIAETYSAVVNVHPQWFLGPAATAIPGPFPPTDTTSPGARKLAHFVEREIERWLSARAVTVALPVEEPKAAPAAPEVAPAAAPGKAGLSKARPLSGPTVPLIAEASSESDELLG